MTAFTRPSVAVLTAVFAVGIVFVAPTFAGADDGAAHRYVLGVEGMTCPVGCAPKVKEALESVDGVESVEVDFEKRQAVVSMKPGKELSQEACDKAFGNSGYFVSSFTPPDAPGDQGGG